MTPPPRLAATSSRGSGAIWASKRWTTIRRRRRCGWACDGMRDAGCGMRAMNEAYICAALRTPVGKHGGALAGVRADDLAAIPIKAVVERAGVDPRSIDDVILGCTNQAGEDNRNVARMALLLAGLPVEVPGQTVNRLCGSGLQAAASAAQAIKAGVLTDELVPVPLPDGTALAKDEYPRAGTTLESVAKLKPAFQKDGTVTAASSSGINDGAAALLVTSRQAKPLARIVATAVAGVDPSCMGLGPIPATQKVLKRAGLTLDQIDLIELNEAFAAQAIACIRELKLDPAKVNIYGGAIALGHPLGATGARLLTTLVHALHRTKSRYGLCTMCIGVGQGIAMIVERA